MKRLAVIFPGIGYSCDRSLLYFSRRIAERFGYESMIMSYSGFPGKIKGDEKKKQRALEIAFSQTKSSLAETDLNGYDDILFIGKSIGTVVASRIAAESPARERIRLVIYTPLEETFSYPFRDAVVFSGTDDPWVGGRSGRISDLCEQKQISCHMIQDANHSLETGDPRTDLMNLQEIMSHTADFIRKPRVERISRYESLLNRLQEAVSEPDVSLVRLLSVRKTVDELNQYYGSEEWKQDYADDEAGMFPAGLSRGVLSEDGIYNALTAYREMVDRIGRQEENIG